MSAKKNSDQFVLAYLNRSNVPATIEQLSDFVQNGYLIFAKRVETDKAYTDVSQEEKEHLLNYFEKRSMTNLYDDLFCPSFTEDEELDLAIQTRIRKLNWICAKHLECGIDETNAQVQSNTCNTIK